MVILQTNFSNFSIKRSSGEEAVINEGEKVSGDLNISGPFIKNQPGAELQIEFEIPVLSEDQSYTVTPTLAMSSKSAYRTSFLSPGFFSSLKASDAGSYTVYADGSLSSQLNGAQEQTLAVTSDASAMSWDTVSATAVTRAMSLGSPSENIVTIHTAEPTKVTVVASDIYNEASLTGEGNEFELSETDEGSVQLAFGDEVTLAEFGHSVIFYTGTATAIETQTNIAPGATATRPADPMREGYQFAGWYTSPNYEELYDFSLPVYRDLRLYARWESDTPSST